ncbi:hypothetical protein ZWY2020_030269, partial [Hordeum vulgare]
VQVLHICSVSWLLLHVLFNMLTFVPLGTELRELWDQSVSLFLMFLLQRLMQFSISSLPSWWITTLYHVSYLVDECSIGFSDVFGLFNVPAKWYAWILLILFQFLASNVSLLGHLSGILSGFAYTYGLFNYLLPDHRFYSLLLKACPCYSLINANFLRNISSWMPSRRYPLFRRSLIRYEKFPGRGRTLASTGTEPTAREASANLHARLLDNSTPSDLLTNSQHAAANTVRADATVTADQTDSTFDEELKLVGMGFERTQAQVALAAAEDDPNVAIEILMSQQD